MDFWKDMEANLMGIARPSRMRHPADTTGQSKWFVGIMQEPAVEQPADPGSSGQQRERPPAILSSDDDDEESYPFRQPSLWGEADE